MNYKAAIQRTKINVKGLIYSCTVFSSLSANQSKQVRKTEQCCERRTGQVSWVGCQGSGLPLTALPKGLKGFRLPRTALLKGPEGFKLTPNCLT